MWMPDKRYKTHAVVNEVAPCQGYPPSPLTKILSDDESMIVVIKLKVTPF